MSHLDVINAYELDIQELRKQRDETIIRLQEECPHPVNALREAEYSPETHFVYASPPFRVCTECGYAEDGWGCGYWKLASNEEIPQMSRDTLFRKYVKRRLTQDELSKVRFGARHERQKCNQDHS